MNLPGADVDEAELEKEMEGIILPPGGVAFFYSKDGQQLVLVIRAEHPSPLGALVAQAYEQVRQAGGKPLSCRVLEDVPIAPTRH
jgi:hypothetical protein